MTLPGGPRPVAGVTLVSVAPTHRRRGLLTEMMRRQLTELHEQQREPAAALWASEGGIYGRFGYGVAARQVAPGRAQGRRCGCGRAPRSAPAGSCSPPRSAARPHEIAVYEQVRPAAVGFLARDGRWWDRAFDDREHIRAARPRDGTRCTREQDGSVTGYATYRLKDNWSPTANESEVRVVDVLATTPEAYAALFSFLAGIDLHPKLVRARAPLDDPLQHLLFDVRALQTDVYDSLWVRLADVGRALAERTYSTPVDVVLEVARRVLPVERGPLAAVRATARARAASAAPTRPTWR